MLESDNEQNKDVDPVGIIMFVATFPLGKLVATRGALNALAATGQLPGELIRRHGSRDWGDLCDEDKELNDREVKDDGQLLSAYTLADGEKLWIITEWDRSVTTLLLPIEY